jgi:hypothetical protein
VISSISQCFHGLQSDKAILVYLSGDSDPSYLPDDQYNLPIVNVCTLHASQAVLDSIKKTPVISLSSPSNYSPLFTSPPSSELTSNKQQHNQALSIAPLLLNNVLIPSEKTKMYFKPFVPSLDLKEKLPQLTTTIPPPPQQSSVSSLLVESTTLSLASLGSDGIYKPITTTVTNPSPAREEAHLKHSTKPHLLKSEMKQSSGELSQVIQSNEDVKDEDFDSESLSDYEGGEDGNPIVKESIPQPTQYVPKTVAAPQALTKVGSNSTPPPYSSSPDLTSHSSPSPSPSAPISAIGIFESTTSVPAGAVAAKDKHEEPIKNSYDGLTDSLAPIVSSTLSDYDPNKDSFANKILSENLEKVETKTDNEKSGEKKKKIADKEKKVDSDSKEEMGEVSVAAVPLLNDLGNALNDDQADAPPIQQFNSSRASILNPFVRLAPIVMGCSTEEVNDYVERDLGAPSMLDEGGISDVLVDGSGKARKKKEKKKKGEEKEREEERDDDDDSEENDANVPGRTHSETDFDDQFITYEIERVNAPFDGDIYFSSSYAGTSQYSISNASNNNLTNNTGRSPHQYSAVFDFGVSVPNQGVLGIVPGPPVTSFWTNPLPNILAASVPSHNRFLSGTSTNSGVVSSDFYNLVSPSRGHMSDFVAVSPSAKGHHLQFYSHPPPKSPQIQQPSGEVNFPSEGKGRGYISRFMCTTPPSGSFVTGSEGISSPVTSQYNDTYHDIPFSPLTYQIIKEKGRKVPTSQSLQLTAQAEFESIIGHLMSSVSGGLGEASAPLHIPLALNTTSPRISLAESLNPDDLLPFTRKPLFVIVDSDAAGSFGPNSSFMHFNNAVRSRVHGQPVVVLMSPTQPRYVPCTLLRNLKPTGDSASSTSLPSVKSSDSSVPLLMNSPFLVSGSTPALSASSFPLHLVPLLPHHSVIGRIYTLALSDPLSAMLLFAHPARCFRAAVTRWRSLPGSSFYPYHPTSIPQKVSLQTCAQKFNEKNGLGPCSCFTLSPCQNECPCLIPVPPQGGLTSPFNTAVTPPPFASLSSSAAASSSTSLCSSSPSSSSATIGVGFNSEVISFLFSDQDSQSSSPPSLSTYIRCQELLERVFCLITRLYFHTHLHSGIPSDIYDFFEHRSWNQENPPSVTPENKQVPLQSIDGAFLRLCEDPFLCHFVLRHCFFNTLLHMHIAFSNAPEECFPSTSPSLPPWLLRHRAWEYAVLEIARELGVESVFSLPYCLP